MHRSYNTIEDDGSGGSQPREPGYMFAFLSSSRLDSGNPCHTLASFTRLLQCRRANLCSLSLGRRLWSLAPSSAATTFQFLHDLSPIRTQVPDSMIHDAPACTRTRPFLWPSRP